MERRNFIQLVAGGLLMPAELFRGRSQVAVGKIWAPVTYINPFNSGIDWDRSFEGCDHILRPFDAHPIRDDAFLGYDRTKLYG